VKFARLYLKAYGPFRDQVVDLEGRHCEFHVLYGLNEAGKSTILRTVTGFLFGIPERTTDAFLHDYTALRVGATLLLPDGGRLCTMRRKARKNTLFRFDETRGTELTDQPLAEDRIDALLGGLNEPLFRSLFGLDLEGLQAGSAALLRGEGEIGQSPFQAAAGLANLHDLLKRLGAEAEDIFKPRGSTARLNVALREATVRSSAWEEADRRLRRAAETHDACRTVLRDLRAEQRRLERLWANLPLVAEHEIKARELDGLDGVPLLGPEAKEQRIAAQERITSPRSGHSAIRSMKPPRVGLPRRLRQRSTQLFRRHGRRAPRDSNLPPN
jgi:exonuclease SbcC